MSNTDQRKKRRGGFYWVDGEPFVSVTTVLQIVDKPALKRWIAREVYLAMVKNPSLSETEALAAPYQASDKAKIRGTTIHSIAEAYKHTREYITTIPEEYKLYAQALYNWMEDNDVEILEHEKSLISHKYGYAGTLDLLVRMRTSGRVFIIDIKTGKDIYDEAFIQLSAYQQALAEAGVDNTELAVLLLETGKDGKPTGNYKFGKGTPCFKVFLAAKAIWEWKNADIIAKLNNPTLRIKQNEETKA